MSEGITANLRLEIEQTNKALNRWVDQKTDWLDSSDASFKRVIEEYTYTISALQDTERQLEGARGKNNSIKFQQQAELERHKMMITKMQEQKISFEKQISTCEADEEREMRRLEIIRDEHDALRERLERSINELTQGVQKYQSLGLELERTDGHCMKFVFTQIDPRDHLRQFYFVLFVDAEDKYNLVETNPRLESVRSEAIITQLNSDNHIGKFVFSMRKAFRSIVGL